VLLQEQNRKAQRRFRERQRVKMSGLEGQVEELQSQNEALRAQMQVLEMRSSILAQVLQLSREECAAREAGDEVKAREARAKIEAIDGSAGAVLPGALGGPAVPMGDAEEPSPPGSGPGPGGPDEAPAEAPAA